MTEASRRQQAIEKLRQERDELQLKMHLGKAELKEEWEALERKWEQLEGGSPASGTRRAMAGREVGAAFGLLTDELTEAYRRIRARLS
jgi:hypothetical protein